jgi:hypothetical protein
VQNSFIHNTASFLEHFVFKCSEIISNIAIHLNFGNKVF